MKVLPVNPALPPAQSGSLLSTAADPGWSDTLTVGQILKSRVLRQFGQGRYELDFAGRSRVVDSAVPLSVGDLLHGKVVGLGERVVIERTQVERAHPDSAAGQRAADAVRHSDVSGHGMVAASPKGDQSGIVDVALRTRAARLAAKADQPERVWRAAAYASRVGIVLDDARLRRFSALLGQEGRPALSRAEAAHFEVLSPRSDVGLGADVALTEQLANWLQDSANALAGDPDPAPRDAQGHVGAGLSTVDDDDGFDNDDGREGSDDAWMARLLNAQTGATFQHRYQLLPVVIDGQLLEFDVALFDHAADDRHADTHSRRICTRIDTPSGAVDVQAAVVGDRVRLTMSSRNAALVDTLEHAASQLGSALGDLGWMLERADYVDDLAGDAAPPARAIVEHVLEQDSLRMEI